MAVAGQRRELALMRAVGATPRQIRRLAAAQATVVAGVALVPGVALGYWLAERFRGMLSARGVIPAELPLTVSPLPAATTSSAAVTTRRIPKRSISAAANGAVSP